MTKEHIGAARKRIRGAQPTHKKVEATDKSRSPQQPQPRRPDHTGPPRRATEHSQPRHEGGAGQHSPSARPARSRRPQRMPAHRAQAPRLTPRIAGQTLPIKNCLRVIPLGGMEEVGRNMTVLEYADNVLIIDMGLQFPEEDMPGIDYIIPNVDYLKGKEQNIVGAIITHAHYDHIGAIPHLIPKLGNPPIFGTDLTIAIIKKRQEEYKDVSSELNLNQITKDSVINLGIFKIEFFGVSHNIPGAVGVAVHTPEGIVIHTGDFKIDERSGIAGVTELDKLARWGKQNPLLLMSDSTNSRETGKQLSEVDVSTELDVIVLNAKGRLIFGTFASLLGRLNEIIQIAAKHQKKLIVEGRSMKINIEIARELGYITVPKGVIIPVEEMNQYPRNEIMILATGAQGEDRAVLMRIANHEHPYIEAEKGDTFVFSSSVIPGNERTVQRLVDKLYREGVEVINYRMMDIHAGGHAKQEDLRKLIEVVKPRFLMPIEGNHSFLCIHGKLAKSMGLTDEQIIIGDNGQIVECSNGVCHKTKERAASEYVFVDGLGVGDVGDVVLRDRQMMAKDGMFVVIATFDSHTRKVRGNPDIISRGFIYMRESKELLMEVRRLVRRIVESSAGEGGRGDINWVYIKDNIREEVGMFLYKKTHRHPMVLPVVIEI
ncbi:MAG: RNase J family beta-CASP ribonuclease [Candidatus Azambacteria bacterium]|nr:RNase J family beta-CASP ribonuclease [Candidatus Azambacteria bacterium]